VTKGHGEVMEMFIKLKYSRTTTFAYDVDVEIAC